MTLKFVMADGDSCQSSECGKGEESAEDESVMKTTGAWLNGWWQSAKVKSSSALEFMKRDLTEFSQVVHQDTVSVVSNTAAILKDKLRVDDSDSVAGRAKQGFNDLLQTVSGALYPTREPDDDELVVIRNSQAVSLDKWQAELYQVQCDPSTFSHEPQGPPELYEKWLEDFNLQDRQQEIDNTLQRCPEVQNIYQTLVPSSVSELEFWQRYFYRVWQLKESKRADIVRRVQPKALEEEMPWDDDDDAGLTVAKTEGQSKPQECFLVSEKPNQDVETASTKTTTDSDISNISPPSCNSSDKGTSDEWEKDFELELSDPTLAALCSESLTKAKEQDEDWESWE